MANPPDPPDIWRQYEIAVDEYRFQIELNWKRSQYYFVLNAAILVAAVSLLTSSAAIASEVVGALFFLGVGVAILAMLATHTQNAYYHAAREHMQSLARKLELGELALKTTPGLGGRARRFGRVTTFQFTMLGFIGLGDAVGGIAAFVSG